MIVFQIVNNISIDSFGGGAEMFALRLAEKVSEDLKSHVISAGIKSRNIDCFVACYTGF